MIKLSPRLIAEMRQHAEREYPHECCGLLVGRIADEGHTREVVELYPVANTYAEDERHHRMQIPPLAYARAERQFAPRVMVALRSEVAGDAYFTGVRILASSLASGSGMV